MEEWKEREKKWFYYPAKRENPEYRLFCFPYAGGGPMVYRTWANELPENIEVIAIRFPGRDSRLTEKPFTDWDTLLDATEEILLPYLDKPFSFFGHSFGARVAFELTKRFQIKNLLLPSYLFISGCRCPHVPPIKPFLHDLPRKEFLKRVFNMNGTPPEILDNPKFIDMLEPAMRADMKLSELWDSTDYAVSTPIVACCGLKDPIDPPENMKDWERYTQKTFCFFTFVGDHFFIHAQEKELLNIISHFLQNTHNTQSNIFFPLSLIQKKHWMFQHNSEKNINDIMVLSENINIPAWKSAWRELCKRHYSLRSTYVVFQDEPRQVIHNDPKIELRVISIDEWTKKEINQFIQKEGKKAMDLERGPLWKVFLLHRVNGHSLQQIVMSPMVGDTYSLEILHNEFNFHYLMHEVDPAQNPMSIEKDLFSYQQENSFIAYIKFLAQQHALLMPSCRDHFLTFWNKQIEDAVPLELSFKKVRHSRIKKYHSYQRKLNRKHIMNLKRLSEKYNVPLFDIVLTAFQIFIFILTGNKKFLINTIISCRSNWVELQNVMGAFTHEIPIKADLNDELTLASAFQKTYDYFLEIKPYLTYPLTLLLNDPVVCQLAFGWEKQSSYAHLVQKPYRVHSRQPMMADIHVTVIEADEKLIIHWQYNMNQYYSHLMKKMFKEYLCFFEHMSANSEEKICDLPFWNNKKVQITYPKTKTIHQLFEEQVKLSSHDVALIYQGKELTYQELNVKANQLAHYLISIGVKSSSLVGICVERSFDAVIGILAILKTGSAYLPFDKALPKERIEFMLQDARITVLLDNDFFVTNQSSINQCPKENPISTVSSNDLAYVNYTSGSTGRPKAVMIPHRGVTRLLFGTNYANFHSKNVFLHLAPMSFDATTFEIWGALLHGAKCVLFDEKLPTLHTLHAIINRYGVNILFITTALFNTIIDEFPTLLSGVKQVLTGGEAHSVSHMRKALKMLHHTAITSVYGPTEATTFSTFYPVKRIPKNATSIPIGQPISHTTTYVLDLNLQPVAVGVVGELYIGGPGVALGYLNQIGLTGEKFINHIPFLSPNEYLYKTGDLVKRLPDGNLDFIGRSDNQIKIHGFRIELGEIESVFMAHAKIKQAVVLVQSKSYDNKKLVAYLIPKDNKLSRETLVNYLKQKLPSYMIPHVFFWVNTFPLTTNGKIDRKLLEMNYSKNAVSPICKSSEQKSNKILEK